MLLALEFVFTRTPGESFLPTYDRCLVRPTLSLHKERASISRSVVCFDGLYIAVRKLSANHFLAHCPHIDHFRPRNHAKLEV